MPPFPAEPPLFAADLGPGAAGLYFGYLAVRSFADSLRLLLVLGHSQCGAVTAAVAGSLDSVQSLHGSLSNREAQGTIALVVLVLAAGGGAVATTVIARAERDRRLRAGAFELPRRGLIGAAIPLVMVGLIALGGLIHEKHRVTTFRTPTTSAQRLVSLTNDRYAYWGVALDSFARHPLVGVGTAGFREEWLAHRPLPEIARDAHSLYIETAAELGLVGVAILAALIAGVAGAARGAVRVYPVRAPGMVAGVVAFGVHAGLDWDWEFPALSLIPIILIGAVIAAGDGVPAAAAAPARWRQRRREGSLTRVRRRAVA